MDDEIDVKKLCGNVLEKTTLARWDGFWDVDWRRVVFAGWRPDDALGVVGGKCTKEVDGNGKHKDGSSRHNNPEMEIYGTMNVYWD